MEEYIALVMEYWFLSIPAALLLILLIHDLTQTNYAILRNFPLVGHFRYLLQMIGPEMRQYWVANDKEEMPFNRSERDWVYASSRGENNNFGFGTSELLYGVGYPIIKNAVIPVPDNSVKDMTYIPSIKVMGQSHKRAKPYRPHSIINISGMSFGSLSSRAIEALNIGAKYAGVYHNTGEGAISDYHLHGADIMWQIGTAYFGCRDKDGNFCLDTLVKKVEMYPSVKCIEIKLSQGAKPGKGGILPGGKVSAEIAKYRGIPEGEDCISPNYHREFSTPNELIDFVERIADKTGLPVGIKAAIGKTDFWVELARLMKERNQGPDFISIDGGEGGTGAAPLTYADHVSLPFKVAFKRVYQIFQDAGISKDIVWIGSGKLGFPDRTLVAIALGCDIIHIAREAMLSIGCIQAQRCHTGECPVGVATQNKWLVRGLDVGRKSRRVVRYLDSYRKELMSLTHSAGYHHPLQFTGSDVEFSSGVNKFSTLTEIIGHERDSIDFDSSIMDQPYPGKEVKQEFLGKREQGAKSIWRLKKPKE